MTFISNSEADTAAAGRSLAGKLKGGGVVALYGDLGAGKTAFVRGLAAGLGYTGRVTSPTFTIVNEYIGGTPLFHFDMYRLKNEDELFEIGWEDYLQRGGVIAVEWSENAEHSFPGDTVRVRISKTGEERRTIDIEFPEGQA
ncbi:tRNA threonylcarbamoyladenosine biosynthesis protein TsaE [Sporobacter termitidis DSM 10068]|uniref:tRNA threonylcarbamoyladenosine biosynthesis protein TsaE n=1 Tax=Sporobacter termitidis DSM 10068 TaxID=1123282 RepID=A0A1M5TBN8_9FIRM|nr:tRNA (adenosine(37)-N6)-threonylcarbamoyltransferase complex ATPase subunit type 1 TsaE [Sporobacter termitidis]SHH48129.1 tRNA threonylcarbamoyladenosine biosynthesis protein TsaE [Sporobacter termitidis DSM 10068]